jgi:hypothetical protein
MNIDNTIYGIYNVRYSYTDIKLSHRYHIKLLISTCMFRKLLLSTHRLDYYVIFYRNRMHLTDIVLIINIDNTIYKKIRRRLSLHRYSI